MGEHTDRELREAAPATLYHYCSMHSFHGIVTSKQFWLSNVFFMNDYMEHVLLVNKARSFLEKRMGSPEEDAARCLLQFFGLPIDPYTFSLSAEADLLSQWRAYSDDGAGVAIGFSFERISLQCKKLGGEGQCVNIGTVLYDDAMQEQLVGEVLGPYLDLAKRCEGEDAAFANAIRTFGTIWHWAALCKHSGFREEKEYRVVMMPQGTPDTMLDKAEFDVGISPPSFRLSGSQIVPYYTFPFSADSITDIRFGPKNRARERKDVLRKFLQENGYDGDRITMTNSEATYR
jgi:hypothetical protein